MSKFWNMTVGFMLMVLTAIAIPALAIEPIPQQSGFGGYVQPSVGYLKIKSNMVAEFAGFDLSDKRINSIFDEPGSESEVIVSLPFEINYIFASTGTQLFLGTQLIDLLRFDFSQQLGVRQEIGSLGVLQGGVLFSSIPSKVWKDPYVQGQNRKDTTRSSAGARLVWDRIFGSAFQAQYTYRNVDISSEKSGQFLGLSSSSSNRLRRDGDLHEATALYRFRFAEKHILTPELILGYEDREGDARTNESIGTQITYTYRDDPISLVLNGGYTYSDYDKRNPIYNKTQEDDTYGVGATVFYKNPWGWGLLGSKPMNFVFTGAYSYNDSNIDFYKEEIVLATAGVLFRW